ncbi:hypothetical protein E4U13_007178 [Claviceps humidiphila]|uniref:Uncharacterized protein n=1 Tax=Claviceps humidiphila TaxID=1294629 RepID=A0A9P7TRK5_9HYPO|nr:hypothetical protein E4U13_007178 [Claviceps humidiphila]
MCNNSQRQPDDEAFDSKIEIELSATQKFFLPRYRGHVCNVRYQFHPRAKVHPTSASLSKAELEKALRASKKKLRNYEGRILFNDQQKLEPFERSENPAVVTDAEGRNRPQFIVLWKDFQQTQVEILKILPSKHKLSRTDTANRAHLRERRKKSKIVDSEKSLKHRQEEALTGPVEFLIKELEHITKLWYFNFHDNDGQKETKPTKSTKAAGKSSIPDTYRRVFASLEGSQLLLIVEYEAPHKLKRRTVKAARASMADMNLDEDVTKTHSQEQII